MSSMQFVIQPLPGTDEQFIDRLREVSDKVNKFGFGTHRIFEQLKIPVKEVVIGPNYLGVLLEDGKAFRVAYSINSERLDLSTTDATKNTINTSANAANSAKSSAPSSSRQLARSRARLMRTGRSGSSGQGSGSRSTGVIIGGTSRPLVTVPATYVPEELISQAEVVLQGKSRNLIIRELQRTNLDVNLAVNNLLSRDDEEAEDTEEGGDNYVPEDLISLLDNGFHGENNSVIIDPADGLFSEEIFSNYSSIRNLLFDRIRNERNQSNANNADANQPRSSNSSSTLTNSSSLATQISSVNADREAFSRWRDRHCYGPRRWLTKDESVWEKDADLKKKDASLVTSPIWISEELQPWPDKNNTIRFKKIGALYSEFIGLAETGELHQWRWSDVEPYKSEIENVYHPKTLSLNLSEKVEQISANFIRCSVVTENYRVATWMDEQLGHLGAKLEHAAMAFTEFTMDPIISINVCSLYTAVRTENNNVYWWGVLPFDQRRYLWDKFRTKTKKPFKTVALDINVGTQVIMKKCPIYQTGSIGFACVNGVPKVGQLLNSVWDFNDVCRFKILNVANSAATDKPPMGSSSSSFTVEKDSNKSAVIPPAVSPVSASSKSVPASASKETTDRIDMPPPPSPASSTCSDTGSVTSHKRPKRVCAKEESEHKKDEELWYLKDVVFVEDKVGPIGKVLKVDGEFVAVRFPLPAALPSSGPAGTTTSANEGKDDDWQQCRLLRREDVQIYKTATTSRGPDWLQKAPKKININHGNDPTSFHLLALSVDTRGIHIIKKIGTKLHYSLYNLYNSKQEQNCQFPTDSVSFMGTSSSNISMHCNNDCCGNVSTIVLRDGNRALYPLAKDCIGSIKDPQWFDLPPVKSVYMTTISLPAISSNLKSKVCITALLFESQKLMPHILRCDVKNAVAMLSRLEQEERSEQLAVLEERCDGSRNIFHACTIMCAPTTNKDTDEKKATATGLSTRRTSFGTTSGTSEGGAAGAANVNAAAGGAQAPVASAGREGGRTVSLRDMINHLRSAETTDQASSNNSAASGEGHVYMPLWSIDANAASAVPSEAAPMSGSAAITPPTSSPATTTEDDVAKIISASGLSGGVKVNPPNFLFDPIQRREQATVILQYMCSSEALRPHLHQMLSAKDGQGQTPFMLSVYCRAYEAGMILLNIILSLAEKDPSLKDSMIFPPGSPPDQSPLHVICYNDTCSFTWTGAEHINQKIYECKTCGLTGSLCCCTECARVCHKGHDCKLKRTSPTAYCDCWEKCKCKALVLGNQQKRFALLCKLASSTDLVTRFNAKGESILLFLIQTVGRQTVEQRQYRSNSRVRNVNSGGSGGGGGSGNTGSTSARKSSAVELEVDMPEHDLEPPKFVRKALERLLTDWFAVRAMIMTGAERCESHPQQAANNPTDGVNADSYNIYLQTQQGSTLLDKFTHNLFVKCNADHLDTLLMTLVREMQSEVEGRVVEAELVARRFVRSVARVFVIFNLEKLPNPEKRKSNLAPNKHIQSCIKVFQTLHKIALSELCEISDALIAPVRLGVVRPTAPFTMSSSNMDNSDDLFSVEPLAPTSSAGSTLEPEVTHENVHDQATGFTLQATYGLEGIDAMPDTAETDEAPSRENNTHNQDEDMMDATRNEEGIQDDESDNDFTFNDAETESDSDDNQSNQDAQRSVQTGATAGSDTDESGESSAQEEDASDDGETDEHSDEFNFADHQLERRNGNSSSRNDTAPQSMQWAIRSRDAARSAVRVPAGSSLVFIDPMALRRSAVPTSSSVAAPPQEHHTMATTASNLARAFGTIVRQISELLSHISYNLSNDIETSLKIRMDEAIQLQESVEVRLRQTWEWMFSVMEGTEAQLKFGAYLTSYTDPNHPLHPLNLSSQSSTSQPVNTPSSSSSSVGINLLGPSSRREFFTYCLSLMRAHSSEHRDALPVLDITALRHIAYVLDAFIYYMRNDVNFYEKNDVVPSTNPASSPTENDDTDDELSNITNEETFSESSVFSSTSAAPTTTSATLPLVGGTSRRHSFFTRSDSTLSLGCLPPEGFELPLDVAIPLADKPHLLQPTSKREELFANLPLLLPSKEKSGVDQSKGEAGIFDNPPTKLGFSTYTSAAERSDGDTLSSKGSTGTVKKTKQSFDGGPDEEDFVPFKKKKYSHDSSTTTAGDDAMDVEESTSQSQNPMATRPEVIITPNRERQRNAEAEGTTTSQLQASTSTVRSVIVRATQPKRRSEDETMDQSHVREDARLSNKPKLSTLSFFPGRGQFLCRSFCLEAPSWNIFLGRWKLTLDLFGRVFMDDVGMEHGSVLPELRGFPVKEMRFRRHMEKLRNGQQRDLIFCKLERNRDSLIIQTFKELNTQFGSQNRRVQPPLTFNRVKVTFKDEPGEGSGVARSFYTSISEALLTSAKMPNLDTVQTGNNAKYGVPFSSILRNRASLGRDMPTVQRRPPANKILWRSSRDRKTINQEARPYVPISNSADATAENANDNLSVHLQQLGERLYSKQKSETATSSSNSASQSTSASTSPQPKQIIPVVLLESCQVEDNEPLFYSPGKRGFYTPRQGYGTCERINAFRNIGRLIGLCLLQNELLPLFLQRHVLKYILGRKIKFHDLAFFDPTIYESFRQLIINSQMEGDESINRMELFFVIDLMKEEGGGSIDLIPGGREIQVTSANIFEYIRRYTEYRLIKAQEKALDALKEGVFDVLPDNCMSSLTSEDLRLLLNGVGDINVSTLISYTTFNDESSEGSDKLLKFKRWFWSIVEKMNNLERQDLVYFWTGSPALPASEEGFQPLPSVTIRPADDTHLPTANTCISRLYIPLYSSKSILRSKLLLAIKSKNFGFV